MPFFPVQYFYLSENPLMKLIKDFAEVALLMSHHWRQLKEQPYYDEQLFTWPLIWCALFYRSGPYKSLNCHEENIHTFQVFFPEAVERYKTFIAEANDYDLAVAEFCGFEFDSSLNTAWTINDIFEVIHKKRSVMWHLKDFRVAAMTATGLMRYLKEADLKSVDIQAVLLKIRRDVGAQLEGDTDERTHGVPST